MGGTALSLQLGHRLSVDIDLFSDLEYGTVNFDAINHFLQTSFPYHYSNQHNIIGMGNSYIVGNHEEDCVKLDIYYTDKFIQPAVVIDDIRMASQEEIIAMKIDVISRGGRKKDFWDIHALKENYSFEKMLSLHKERYPYTHDKLEIQNRFSDFSIADEDFEPLCLMGKYWEIIKLDLLYFGL